MSDTMQSEKITKRFTLRKEYFGGLLHDVNTMNCDIFFNENSEFYELLKNLENEEGRQKAVDKTKSNKDFKNLTDRLVMENALDANFKPLNIRVVEPPIPLVEGTIMAPLRVYDTYGFGCNLHCVRCLNNSERAKLDLNRRSLEDTATIMKKFYDVGTMEWRFTGGEPTVYNDLFDSISIAKSFGMAVMLNSNGVWEKSKRAAILESGINAIIISIEGTEKTNDLLRGRGVYKSLTRTLSDIQAYNLHKTSNKIDVTINMTIGKQNSDDVEFLVRYAAFNGFNINFVPTRPYGRATVNDMLSTEEFMMFSKNVQRLREDSEIRESGIKIIHRNMDLFNYNMPDKSGNPFPFNYSSCGALATGFGLSPDGSANACSFLAGNPAYVGLNMADEKVTVYDAWLDPKMEDIRKAVREDCNKCDYYMRQCEGKCYAMVLANNGKIEDRKIIGRDQNCFSHLMKIK